MEMQTETASAPAPRKTKAELGEVRGSGIIVAHRNKKGRLVTGKLPFEHGTRELAVAEAEKLAARFPDKAFCVLITVEQRIGGNLGS